MQVRDELFLLTRTYVVQLVVGGRAFEQRVVLLLIWRARIVEHHHRVADQSKQSLVLQLGSVQVDLEAQTCRGPHGSINLTPQEYRVLDCLGRRAGLLVLRRELLRQVWGPDRSQDDRNLRTCIKNLRNKLEPDPARPSYLVTEVGLGYRLRAQLDVTQRNSGLTHQLT